MKFKFVFALILSGCIASCGDTDMKDAAASSVKDSPGIAESQQLNVNILWDLSDRIDPNKSKVIPAHYERDIQIIQAFTEYFKKDMDAKGAYRAKGKLKVFFTPPPADPEINNVALALEVDLSKFSGDGSSKEKKKVYDNITTTFVRNAQKVFELTMRNNARKTEWDGSDIWRFFKNDVDRCVEPGYRNILVILTDGYIYHKDSKGTNGTKTQFLLPQTLAPFRNNPKWQELFSSKGYGLEAVRTDLKNLEVLVLEIQPSAGNKNDEDYIKAYLYKWFEDMGIPKGNASIFTSDLPANTRKRIEDFLEKS